MQKTCGIWINILSHMIKRRLNATMQRLGLTGVQGHVMHFIVLKCADGPVYQRDVEAAFGLSRSTATGILQLMEKNGLIQRESAADDARLSLGTLQGTDGPTSPSPVHPDRSPERSSDRPVSPFISETSSSGQKFSAKCPDTWSIERK